MARGLGVRGGEGGGWSLTLVFRETRARVCQGLLQKAGLGACPDGVIYLNVAHGILLKVTQMKSFSTTSVSNCQPLPSPAELSSARGGPHGLRDLPEPRGGWLLRPLRSSSEGTKDSGPRRPNCKRQKGFTRAGANRQQGASPGDPHSATRQLAPAARGAPLTEAKDPVRGRILGAAGGDGGASCPQVRRETDPPPLGRLRPRTLAGFKMQIRPHHFSSSRDAGTPSLTTAPTPELSDPRVPHTCRSLSPRGSPLPEGRLWSLPPGGEVTAPRPAPQSCPLTAVPGPGPGARAPAAASPAAGTAPGR